MAVVLEALASYIQNMVREMALEEMNMLFGVPEEINKMDIKLRDPKCFLADAERRNITDESVRAWVGDLRNAMYEATNILDICQLKAMGQGETHDAGRLNPLGFSFINLSSYEDRSRWVASSRPSSRETSGMLDESSVVGEKIEEDTRNLVEMLTTEDENKITIFAIVGVGGIGKTTIAQKIFNHEIIQQEFPKKIWLSVNQDFNPIELLRRAVIEAGGDHQSAGNMRTALERALKDALNGQKFLFVMDDVWDHRAWDCVLKIPLVNASLANGCRVLVTTRHDAVARGMMAKRSLPPCK